MKIALGVVMLCGLAGASKLAHNALVTDDHDAAAATDREWAAYKARYSKLYDDPQEDSMRRSNWLETKRQVEEYNSEHGYGRIVNEFADWTNGERSVLIMDSSRLSSKEKFENEPICQAYLEQITSSVGSLPSKFDWRGTNRLCEVKHQGKCDSSWAFATTGLLEGQFNISGPSIPLSEQQLMECNEISGGCGVGWVDTALKSIVKYKGIQARSTYKYKACAGSCKVKKENGTISNPTAVLKVQTPCAYSNLSEDLLKALVVNYGPVAVYMHAHDNFFSQDSSVYGGTECDGKPINHAVLIVGYGVDEIKGNYWVVKNSWGLDFGDEGYFKIISGINKCNIEESAFIAFARTLFWGSAP